MVDLSQIEAEMAHVRARYPEEVSDYAAQRWVRVMCDNSADGVWAKDGGGFDCTSLPITPDLVRRIRLWQRDYERLDHFYFNRGKPDWSAFGEHGFQIALEMKRQLPEWTIVYRDERRQYPELTEPMSRRFRLALGRHPDLDASFRLYNAFTDHYRPWAEYEITPEVIASGMPPDNFPDGPPAWLAGRSKGRRKPVRP